MIFIFDKDKNHISVRSIARGLSSSKTKMAYLDMINRYKYLFYIFRYQWVHVSRSEINQCAIIKFFDKDKNRLVFGFAAEETEA